MQKKTPIINHIWFWLMVIPILVAIATGRMEAVTTSGFESAASAVELAVKLIGVMTLWLGLTKIAEVGGLMTMIARGLKPVMRRLFPDVPPEHPAMGAMVMNFAANMLGLGNAATPLGIKAMLELNTLNRTGGQATNAMILFLAINTSSIALLPLGVIGIRAAAGAKNPADIMIPGLLATVCSTAVAITAGLLFNRLRPNPSPTEPEPSSESLAEPATSPSAQQASAPATSPSAPLSTTAEPSTSVPLSTDASSGAATPPLGLTNRLVPTLVLAAAVAAIVYRGITAGISDLPGEIIKWWLIPLIMLALVLFGYRRGVNVYEVACEGGREGFQTAVRIIPFLVMVLVAVGMFRASGAFDLMTRILDPFTSLVGIPSDVLPIALMRPLTGSGSFAILSELTVSAPNGLSAFMAAIMQGSTETTFYVLAVYFGSVGITKIRHALYPALLADAAGLTASVILARAFFG